MGGDPFVVETEEQAMEVLESIQNATIEREITDKEEFETALSQLELKNAKHIYSYVDGSEFIICFAEDWDYEQQKRYSVYICGITESKIATIMPDFKEARFDTEEEAREYIAEQLKGYQVVCPEDNNLDTANNHHWFELYDGDPVTIDEEGDEHLNDPIFTSDMVYND